MQLEWPMKAAVPNGVMPGMLASILAETTTGFYLRPPVLIFSNVPPSMDAFTLACQLKA